MQKKEDIYSKQFNSQSQFHNADILVYTRYIVADYNTILRTMREEDSEDFWDHELEKELYGPAMGSYFAW